MVVETFIRNLRRKRKDEMGYTMAKLAELIGVSHGYIAKLEAGQRWPSQDILEKIAITLGTTPAELLRDTNDPNQVLIHSPTLPDVIKLLEAFDKASDKSRDEALKILGVG